MIPEPNSVAPLRLMSVLAHPDDETFGGAGLMARATASGHMAAAVCATRGEAGEIANPTLATPETLGKVREQELRTALSIVGVTDVSFLDYLDGHLAEADPHEAIGRIVAQLRRFHPDIIVTFAPNGMYGHPDHMAISRFAIAAVSAAADPAQYPEQIAAGLQPHRVHKVYMQTTGRERLLEFRALEQAQGRDFIPGGNAATIPVEEMGSPLSEITTIVRLTDDELALKMRAMRAHATQISDDNPFINGTPDEMRERMGAESFILAPPPISEKAYPTPETDLFSNL